jgi:hypothetical protein
MSFQDTPRIVGQLARLSKRRLKKDATTDTPNFDFDNR